MSKFISLIIILLASSTPSVSYSPFEDHSPSPSPLPNPHSHSGPWGPLEDSEKIVKTIVTGVGLAWCIYEAVKCFKRNPSLGRESNREIFVKTLIATVCVGILAKVNCDLCDYYMRETKTNYQALLGLGVITSVMAMMSTVFPTIQNFSLLNATNSRRN